MNKDELTFLERIKPTITKVSEVEAPQTASVPLTLRNLFFHPNTHPIALDFALLKAFGPEWFLWEPETIWAEIQKEFKTQISELTKDKIMAVKTAHVVTSPWMHWQVFEKMVQTLTNVIPMWDIVQVPTIEQLFAGVDILNQIRNEQFDEEVRQYIAACLINDNISYAPPPLDFAQVELVRPIYRCRDCSHEFNAIYNSGHCPNCTDQYISENGLSFTPDKDLVDQGKGKSLDLVLTNNPEDIERRWNQVEGLPEEKINLHENAIDVQVSKLLSAKEFMLHYRKQLVEQLTSLKSWLRAE